jgi:PPM family protein phosphatase
MQCPKCNTSILPEDNFCEECGSPLKVIPNNNNQGCKKCGAQADAIDDEGFCSHCGFRNELKDDQRIEINIDKYLAGVSDRGLRHHQNEDNLALTEVNNGDFQIIVVCDGVSSCYHPEKASEIAAKTTKESLILALELGESPENSIKKAFACAFESLANLAESLGLVNDPPSTTMVAAVVSKNKATIGWLGDSRAYWLGSRQQKLLTTDDSWLNEVVTSGEMTEIQAQYSPQAHAITRWLGADAVDNMMPHIINYPIIDSGFLLLCTDGLWNYASSPNQIFQLIQQLIKQQVDSMTISKYLVEFARRCGGKDNITVGVLRVDNG